MLWPSHDWCAGCILDLFCLAACVAGLVVENAHCAVFCHHELSSLFDTEAHAHVA